MKLAHIIQVVVGGVSLLSALYTPSASADSRSPLQGNPIDTLPLPEAAPRAPMTINVQPQAIDPALVKLLNSHLVPSRFQISGVKTLPFDQIAAQFAPFANHDTTVAELLTAANKVTQMYREQGYPLSFAFIPAQNFENNIVVVTIVEGYVKNVKVEGNPGNGENRLKAIAEQLKEGRPLRQDTFERVAGILSLQPGVQVVANVPPPTTTDGGTDMILTVKRKPVTAGIGADYRQPGIRGLLTATENGLTPLGEQITVSTLQPGGSLHEKFYAINYVQPIGTDGVLAKVNWSDYRSEPESQSLDSLQFQPRYQTKTVHVGAAVSYPIFLDNTHNLTATGGIYAAENSETFTRSVPTTPMSVQLSSQVRVLSAEGAWTTASPSTDKFAQIRQIGVGLYKGIDGLGASRQNSNVDLSFTRITVQASQSNQLPGGFGVAFAGSAQYSNNILPTSEQIGFGGKLFGLAYPVGELAGDKGWGVSAEINRLFAVDMVYLKSVQPYILIDHSRVYANSGPLTHDTLGSIAIGARFAGGRIYSFDLSLAKPVADKPFGSDSRSPRVNAMYSYQME
ncbi:ShlB/FhaC/HecB family hemolysin secretion/activation protein [Glaciimonas sp. PAMC28666]|uniref:ShlB/FhaC/HecB family hemolysin secretion/activation protein n=1 Tax=Glaciimonas sp. PAMC28666 TaxID=2807626 RepID=UPI001964DA25|nr:ShlB/FhaC/HecB family hemolysin secretion/activation protein [Glaciimonas sp. PAMC28666]QRX83036.1 ShlB/FhaC/HecB family hemolysin secretion/activation protein [Glaciimonas sp. PAMC28666]